MKNKKQKGFTLIETLLTVGFVALASVGVYQIFTKADGYVKAGKESKNLDIITKGLVKSYETKANYGGLTNALAYQNNVVPVSMKTTTGAIAHSMGGTVDIVSASIGSKTNNGFSVIYRAVPSIYCAKMIGEAAKISNHITVGTSVVLDYTTNQKQINVPELTQACANQTDITFSYFSLDKGN